MRPKQEKPANFEKPERIIEDAEGIAHEGRYSFVRQDNKEKIAKFKKEAERLIDEAERIADQAQYFFFLPRVFSERKIQKANNLLQEASEIIETIELAHYHSSQSQPALLVTELMEFEGIGSAYVKKLTEAGVATVELLLETGCTPKGRESLAEKTGISHTLIQKWVNRADLARIKGIGSEYADLLEVAGVDTVVELGKRVPANLLKKMEEVNEAKKLVRRLPAESQVVEWVEQAKKMERVVTY